MILSYEHRFIFIKGHKVAGTSVEIALSQLCGPEDIITPITVADEATRCAARNYSSDPAAEQRWLREVRAGTAGPPKRREFYNHMPLSEVAAKVDLTGFKVFFVERSPYSKVLSFLNWDRSRHEYRADNAMVSTPEQIVAWFEEKRVQSVRNIDLYRWPDGRLAGTPWRYNDLPQPIADLAERIGRPVPALPHAKQGMRSDGLDPAEWFTEDQLEYIESFFAEEFDAFGYPRLPRRGA